MSNNRKENIPQLFDKLFSILSSDRFIRKEGLGGNKPIFIQPYEISQQVEVDKQIAALLKRLNNKELNVLSIDLYKMCLDILAEKGTLAKILQGEKSISKREFKRTFEGSLSIKDAIIPYLKNKMSEMEHKMIFIYGIDKVYPMVSFVSILVNIQSILNNEPFIFFYPGNYDNISLDLFGCIHEDNEYRAFNLNNYK